MAVDKCVKILTENYGMERADALELAERAKSEALSRRLSQYDDAGQRAILSDALAKIIEIDRVNNIKARLNAVNDIRIFREINAEWQELQQTASGKAGDLSFYKFMTARLVGHAQRFQGARSSISAQMDAMREGKEGHLAARWGEIAERHGMDNKAVFKILSNKDNVADQLAFMEEIWAPTQDLAQAKNPFMAEVAKAWVEVAEDLRIRENLAGGNIGKLSTGYFPQSHEPYKLLRYGNESQNRWVNYVMDRLDWETTMPDVADADRVTVLSTMFNTIKLGRDLLLHIPEFPTVGKRLGSSQHRVLHFKDARSFLEYQNEYGTGSLTESMRTSIRQSTARITLRENLGSNPWDMVSRLVETEKQKLRAKTESAEATSEIKVAAEKSLTELERNYNLSIQTHPAGTLANYMREVMGETYSPVNPTGAKIGASLRAFQALVSMGLSGLSSITDISTAATMQRAFGVEVADRFGSAVFDYFRSYKGDKRRIAQELGFLNTYTWGSMLNRLDVIHDPLPGVMSKTMNKFYKWSGLSPMSEQKRTGNAMLMSRFLGYSRNTSWDNLAVELRKGMEYHGFTAETWGLMRHMMEEVDGNYYLNATMAQRLSDAQLEHLLPEFVRTPPKRTARMYDGEYADVLARHEVSRQQEFYKIRNRLETEVLAFFSDNSKFAVMEPDTKSRAAMHQGTRSGTWLGEGLRFIMQFKSWPMMMVQRHVQGRTWQKFGSDAKITSDIPGAAHFIVLAVTTGYLSQTLKELAKGKTAQDPRKWQTWNMALWQSGVGGIFGDAIFGPQLSGKGAIANAIVGPVLGKAEPLVDALGSLVAGDTKQARKDAAAFVSGNIPFSNLWLFKGAFDYYVMHAAKEAMSPGYIQRLRRNAKEITGQEYWMYGGK